MKFTFAQAVAFNSSNPNAIYVIQDTAAVGLKDVIYRIYDYTYSDEVRAPIGSFNQTLGIIQDYDGTVVDQEYYNLVVK